MDQVRMLASWCAGRYLDGVCGTWLGPPGSPFRMQAEPAVIPCIWRDRGGLRMTVVTISSMPFTGV